MLDLTTSWKKAGSLLIVAICLLSIPLAALAAPITYPEPKYVSDYAGVLSQEQLQALTDKVLTFKQETSNEIAVLIVPTTAPETIEEYSIHVTDKWKIGKQGKDNGVLFTVAVNDRTMRLEIGRGLEGAIPDISTVKILNTYARPKFKENKYYEGINDALDVIMAAAKGEFNTAELSDAKGTSENNDGIFTVLFYAAIGIFGFFLQYMASTKSWWLGGVVGSVGAFIVSLLLSFGLFSAFFLAIVFGFFGLIVDLIVSKAHGKKGGGGGWWWGGGGSGGGWGSGGGGSSFGGGSFSGGGGSSNW